RFTNGKFARDVPQKPGKIEKDKWYQLTVKLRGQDVSCYLEDVLLFEQKDELFASGRIGLRTVDTVARFRDIMVTDPAGKILWSGLPPLPPVLPDKERLFWAYDQGYFFQRKDGDWEERGAIGTMFRFKERSRNDDVVEIYDDRANVGLIAIRLADGSSQ